MRLPFGRIVRPVSAPESPVLTQCHAWSIDDAGIQSRSKISPWHGRAVKGLPLHTIVRGCFVMRDRKLAPDAIVVKEVMLRDIELPAEYAKGLEGLLLKEQENERLGVEVEVKRKQVQTAELEAEAEKARQVKAAEGQAQVVVLQARAQSDAMQIRCR